MTITEQLAEALREAIADIQWMSGSSDFAPGGQAYAGWQEIRGKLQDRYNALAAYEASKATPTLSPLLWCCHVRGPDDVHPAPDYQTALKWSDMINDWSDEANAKFKDGEKVMSKAAPALWPWSPESHAQNLAKAIADFSPRLHKERAENEHEPAGQSGSPGA